MAAEKTFENKIKDYIEDHGGWYVKFFANRMTKKGIPDILACINGYFVAIEVKAKHGEPSELQKYHVRKIIDAGGLAIILYPQDWELFVRLVKYLQERSWLLANIKAEQINERSFENGA